MNPFVKVASLLRWRDLAFTIADCPACNRKQIFVRLQRSDIGVRCTGCKGSVVALSLITVLRQQLDTLQSLHVYELSTRGAVCRWLAPHTAMLTTSEFFNGVQSGNTHHGVLCQDVEALSFAENSFDLCTSTDVFEHVRNDRKGFTNLARVLKPGGKFIFTVPLYDIANTLERVAYDADGGIKHLLPPEYHGDPVGESGEILALRNYGRDICDRLVEAGFAEAHIVMPTIEWLGFARPVIVATK